MFQLRVGGHLERHMVPWTLWHTMNSRSRVEVSVEIFTADWAALFLQIELDQTDL